MKSARVEFRTTSAALASAATSLRFPFSFLFLVAVLTLLSYRTATVSRVFNYHPFDQIANSHLPDLNFSVSPPPLVATPLNPLPNATTYLLRLASIDVNEKADTSEIQDLLDANEDSMHRSVVLWRRFHRLDVGNENSVERFSRLFPDFHRSLRQWSRNRRLQPGVMFELLDLVKRPIDRHRGVVTDQRNKKYRTCAVVGNSGILLKHRDGDLIDGHDLVIRLNYARTNGYERNVGRKTSLAFVNSNILHVCSRREGCRCHPYGPDVPMITYICQPVHFLDYTICNGSYRTPPLLVTDARFDFLCSSIVKYYSLKRFVEKTGKSPEEWDKAHDVKMFHYSSGMQAVMLALGICDQVSIFGFGKSADAKHHYHTGQRSELDLHDYEAEYDLYRDLAERPQVIPFLAHSVVGFKVPPVVIRHGLT